MAAAGHIRPPAARPAGQGHYSILGVREILATLAC